MSGLQPHSFVVRCSVDAAHPLGCACSCFARPQGLHVAEVTSRRLADDLSDGTEVAMVVQGAAAVPGAAELDQALRGRSRSRSRLIAASYRVHRSTHLRTGRITFAWCGSKCVEVLFFDRLCGASSLLYK